MKTLSALLFLAGVVLFALSVSFGLWVFAAINLLVCGVNLFMFARR